MPIQKRRKTAPAPRPRRRVARVPRTRISGRGAYSVATGPWANRGAKLGELIGGEYGGNVGRKVGGWIGRRAFHYPARLFGSGDYQVSSGGAGTLAPQLPSFSMAQDGMVISHREYIGDIITGPSAGDTVIQKFALAPSESATFPWLSQVAQCNFQQYKFEGCVFEFRSFSADALNSTNTALGAVFSAINYDFTDADLTTRSQIENTSWSMSAKPSESFYIPVECESKQSGLNGGLLYIPNTGGVPNGADPKTYYLGKVFIGTTGFQGTNVNVGSLYVTYKIKLIKPISVAPLSCANRVNYFRTGATNALPFGDTTGSAVTYPLQCDTLGCSFTGTVMTIKKDRLVPGSRYFILIYWVGASTASLALPLQTYSSNLETPKAFQAWTAGVMGIPATNGTTNTSLALAIELNVLSSNADSTIELGTGGTLPTGAYVQVYMTQINGMLPSELGYYTGY